MKLQCQVEIVNRLHSSLNIRSHGKYLKSTLALGKEPKNGKEYFILHFSSVNKTGTKYRLKFIKQVFVKCLNEGKATIRFEEPPHDLCIKSETIQLKGFMRLLKQCITGETKEIPTTNLCSINVTAKEIAPTKLVIHDRSEFPSKGLPRTLEALYLSGLKLYNFRRDILLLRHLSILDLSNNEIEKLPPELGRMPNVTELYLANNQLGEKEIVDWRWLTGYQLSKSLKLLDLSGNKLKSLPKSIWKLHRLVTLKLDNNSLEKLPITIGRLSSLRYLSISRNELDSLPCSLLQCRLESLDVSTNKLYRRECSEQLNLQSQWDLVAGSLVNISAKIVLKHKIFYASHIIPWTLVSFLDNANICVCGTPVVNDIMCKKVLFQLKNYYQTVIFDNSSSVMFDCVFCSYKCYNRFSLKKIN